jgi:hypothetical protein
MMLDESRPLLCEGEAIPPGNWFGCPEDDGDYLVYYTTLDGRVWGTQSTDVRHP